MIEQILKTTRKYLQAFLSTYLPQISNDWWQHCVINELSFQQKQTILDNNYKSLHNLDLAMLLIVFKKNFNFIAEKAQLSNSLFNQINNLIEIRNKYAHLNDEIDEDFYYDLETIRRFYKTIGFNLNEIDNLKSNQSLSQPVTQSISNEITIISQNRNQDEVKDLTQMQPEFLFSKGEMVCLKADLNSKGAVTDIIESINETKYKVLINNSIKEFFESQLVKFEETSNIIENLSKDKLNAFLTSDLLLHPNKNALYSLNSANIDFVPYQYRPVIKIINSEKPRILIADEVGLGKTIEAGIILKELQVREDVKSVLVICPKALIIEHKWKRELKKFGEDFEELDSTGLKYVIDEFDNNEILNSNKEKLIVPYSILNDDLLEGINNQTGLLHLDPPLQFDLVIVDEAHRICNPNTQGHRVVSYFTEHAKAVVFLTATPIQNKEQDLFTLINVLRPDMIKDYSTYLKISEPNTIINQIINIIREKYENNKHEIPSLLNDIKSKDWFRSYNLHNPNFNIIDNLLMKDTLDNRDKVIMLNALENLHTFSNMISRTRRRDIGEFTIRDPKTIKVEFTLDQEVLYNNVISFIFDILRERHGNINVKFMTSTILRQTSSSLFGLLPFLDSILNRHYENLKNDLDLQHESFDYENDVNFQNIDFIDKLNEIKTLITKIDKYDPKVERLIEIIQEKQKLNNKKVIVFSSFRHTISYISQKLTSINIKHAIINGDVNSDDRYTIKERFSFDNEHPEAIDVLLSTEVGSEGLDFQFADCLVNYDLPWNPMRIEQRIGRIDRYGQQSEIILIYNFVTPKTIDYEIYTRCLDKIGVFKSAIGGCEEILGKITSGLSAIALDYNLTEEQRNYKIDQLAINKERELVELDKLESENIKLFSVNLPDSIFKTEIENYTNQWLTSDAIENLVKLFIKEKFNKDAITGESEIKNLRLSIEDKKVLLEEIKANKISTNNNTFARWLQNSSNSNLSISFNGQNNSNNKKYELISSNHILLKLTSKHFENLNNLLVKIEAKVPELNAGIYEFGMYRWEYKGVKNKTEYVIISDNEYISNYLKQIIDQATLITQTDLSIKTINNIENLHLNKWKTLKANYITGEEMYIDEKIKIIQETYNLKINIIKEEMRAHKDEKILKMKNAEIHNKSKLGESAINEFDVKKTQLDIYTQRILIGQIEIRG